MNHDTIARIGVPGLLLLSALWLAMSTSGCSRNHGAMAPQAPQVKVVTVRRTPVPLTTELPGRTSAYLLAQVRARVDGIVLSRDFQEGGEVRPNQRLFRIDPAPYRAALLSAEAQLARARASLESAKAQLERDEVLVAADAISRQRYVNDLAAQGEAAADVQAAIAAVEVAKINLGYTEVVSPIEGRIGPALVTPGAYVQASAATLMATIQQIDPIYVDLSQASVEGLELAKLARSGRLQNGEAGLKSVRLMLEDGSHYPREGTLEFSGITVDTGTAATLVRAIFPNPDHHVLPGMFVRAVIDRGTDTQAILVPEDGVTHDRMGRTMVLVVDAQNKVQQRQITAGRIVDNQWVVTAGLDEGERVIVSGAQRVLPGMVVEVLPPETETAPHLANAPDTTQER